MASMLRLTAHGAFDLRQDSPQNMIPVAPDGNRMTREWNASHRNFGTATANRDARCPVQAAVRRSLDKDFPSFSTKNGERADGVLIAMGYRPAGRFGFPKLSWSRQMRSTSSALSTPGVPLGVLESSGVEDLWLVPG